MANSDLVQSLLRGLDLLKIISARQEGTRLNELAVLTGMKKPTLHNLLRTLAARGFVVKDEVNRFRLGPGLLEIVSSQRSADRRSRAAGKLRDLAEIFPDSVITLSVLNAGEINSVFRISPDYPGELQQPEDHRFVPYTSASAVVLQAVHPQKTRHWEAVYPFDEYGAGMWGNVENFKKVISEVSRKKWYSRTGNSFLIAFAMPGGYALGFKAPLEQKDDVKRFLEAAGSFRKAVWGEDL